MTRFLILVALAIGCAQPKPVPTPTPADAAVPDLFTSQIYDCTGLDTTEWKPYARTCGDSSDTRGCMIAYVNNSGLRSDKLACAARDVEVAAFRLVAQGIATDDDKTRAASLRLWIKMEYLTFRGAP